MFIDRARVFVKAGDGGDGMSSFRREKYVPNGGPSGGDGGQGADVVLKADKNINTLVDFRYKRQFKAPKGGNGESANKHGRGAEDLIIPVPSHLWHFLYSTISLIYILFSSIILKTHKAKHTFLTLAGSYFFEEL